MERYCCCFHGSACCCYYHLRSDIVLDSTGKYGRGTLHRRAFSRWCKLCMVEALTAHGFQVEGGYFLDLKLETSYYYLGSHWPLEKRTMR